MFKLTCAHVVAKEMNVSDSVIVGCKVNGAKDERQPNKKRVSADLQKRTKEYIGLFLSYIEHVTTGKI